VWSRTCGIPRFDLPVSCRSRESAWGRNEADLRGAATCNQAPNTDHLCETARAKIQQLATPTGVQTRRLLLDAVLNIRQSRYSIAVKLLIKCAPGGTRTPGPLVRRPSLDRSQVDDFMNNSVGGSSNISPRYAALSACLPWIVTSNIRRDRPSIGDGVTSHLSAEGSPLF
jgi:hypothetical protein